MYRAVEQHCNANPAIVSVVAAFETAFDELVVVITSIGGTEQLVTSPLAGIAADKTNTKQALIELTAEIAGSIYAFAVVANNETLKAEADLNVTKLNKTRDEELAPRCQNIHDRAQANLFPLNGYGVTAAKLTALQTAIDTYAADVPKPRTAVANRKTQNINLVELFRQGDAILKDRMDKLVGNLRAAHPDFVTTYEAARIIIDPPTTSTQLKGTVTKASDNSPIFNATVTAVTPVGIVPVVTRSTTSDTDGKYKIKPIPHGVYDITVTATGFETFTDPTVELKFGESTIIDAVLEGD